MGCTPTEIGCTTDKEALDKIKEIESVLNGLNLNYKIENMDIKNPKNEKGNEKNYVDCIMTIKVI